MDENINLLGCERAGIGYKAHFMNEICFLSTQTLLQKINSTVLESHYRVLIKSKEATVAQVQWTLL